MLNPEWARPRRRSAAGTGLDPVSIRLRERCQISSPLTKVLHMDRNDYYGGDSTSLNLNQLWKKFRGEDKPPAHLGASRDYNVDMVPKVWHAPFD
ncbi:guanosine nucleotide diphosphate dissociation inhibitor 1-like [Hordeum vulgare subsp. vulgare]|uniref:guanosine nucleotide diphosphate dissociation inhibitor 1-like n=1 Tax=Hordeum vulgare subsp. vulgare TaxID=112509 RepID=UPI001D1A5731|nr:guanosine nucleotide diphosphate dissociation inhibitor 1-like [Hordeum vulgare subsp. vulgare]